MAEPCQEARVSRLAWTTQKRCSWILNARRWRCKQPPTQLIEFSNGTGAAVCDEHLEALRCPSAAR